MDYKLLLKFFRKKFVVYERSAFKNSFSTYVFYIPDGFFVIECVGKMVKRLRATELRYRNYVSWTTFEKSFGRENHTAISFLKLFEESLSKLIFELKFFEE